MHGAWSSAPRPPCSGSDPSHPFGCDRPDPLQRGKRYAGPGSSASRRSLQSDCRTPRYGHLVAEPLWSLRSAFRPLARAFGRRPFVVTPVHPPPVQTSTWWSSLCGHSGPVFRPLAKAFGRRALCGHSGPSSACPRAFGGRSFVVTPVRPPPAPKRRLVVGPL